ncbi:GntR family transcriptional regulator [Alicyclobacillus fodiniaquatilis]|uniref:GntR family transcriptional regulator n=1 Tax=Alicyclobacillus fodiniaquatilis TaxID=1661150 RepID=A0ABW4JG65_9BACL
MRESVPLYKQLKSRILEQIRQGHWKPGQQLPSEAELSLEFDVSRTTVRQALGDLVSGGFVIRRQGKGTYVAERVFTSSATTLYGFAEALRELGVDVIVRIERLEEQKCPPQIAAALGVSEGRKTLLIERTAWVENECYFRDKSYILPPFHLDIGKISQQPDAFDYIYGFFEQNGVRINSGHQTIAAQLATDADCEQFSLEAPAPMLVIERITRDETGAAVEFSEVRYPAERYQFSVNLLRQADAVK